MAHLRSVEVAVELSAVVVRPGDIMIVLHKGALSAEMADTIKERARTLLPGICDVVVFQADGLAVYRPDPVSGDDEHTG